MVRAHLAKREQNLALKYHPGARLVFADGTPDILAYPRDRAGWGRLTRLLTLGNLRAEKGECILHLDDLLAHIFGLELVVMGSSSFTSPVVGEVGAPLARSRASSTRYGAPGEGETMQKLSTPSPGSPQMRLATLSHQGRG